MLRKLLETVNFRWAKNAEIQKPLTLQQGTGTNPYLTIKEGIVYLHRYPDAPDILPNQEIILDGLTISDLCTQLTSMGYTVDSSEAVILGTMGESSLTLLDADSQNLTNTYGVVVFAFASNFHRVLYPIHRLLTTYNGDIDKAIEQLMLPATSGTWLDYWCSFFNIQRLPSEDDQTLLRRVFLNLTSAKSNNLAMEELISYYIGTDASVIDAAPSQIEVRVDPLYMDSSQKVRDIIATIKSAAVDYFINYQKTFSDSYSANFRNTHGKTFSDFNSAFGGTAQLPTYADNYRLLAYGAQTFYLNTGTLNNSSNRLASPNDKVIDSPSMVMTDSSGTIVQQM